MSPRSAELVIETWRVREHALPRVPPDGWETVDRLREAVCLAVACAVEGVEEVESFEGPAAERERFEATVTADSIDHEHVRLASPTSAGSSTDDGAGSSALSDARGEDFDETTEQFDLDDALNRL
ncbi:hypothetical protein EKH57_12090 [Halorubrum sp. BOL3-1]|uniref:hypothetical protein n=1 Tax=Halorubrum sp. BOL3-1 TaxID=2497325 RepID=UPI00100506C9|nr:hypothetical protein [Halorubrum sp. BOL3-1]QAU13393.1 hypothetical protein EKH57_12090 [Halorubrum sp. BOL3-1]